MKIPLSHALIFSLLCICDLRMAFPFTLSSVDMRFDPAVRLCLDSCSGFHFSFGYAGPSQRACGHARVLLSAADRTLSLSLWLWMIDWDQLMFFSFHFVTLHTPCSL